MVKEGSTASASAPQSSSGRKIVVGNVLDVAAAGLARSQSQRLRELTRTATPATPVCDALANLAIDTKLHSGIKTYKICSNGKIVERLLTLSRANFVVFVTPRRVPGAKQYTASTRIKVIRQRVRRMPVFTKDEEHHTPRYLDIADITEVQSGFVGTHKLELSRSKYLGSRHLFSITSLTRDWSKVIEAAGHFESGSDAIVSIIYGAKRDTLDLLIPDESERNMFVNALLLIRKTYHRVKEDVSSEELLLRYIWYEVDINKNGRIDRHELKEVLRRINITHKGNLKTDYREFVRKQYPDSRWELAKAYSRGLDYKECLRFVRWHKTCSDAWDNVFGSEVDRVSAIVFLEVFLHQNQDEYDATLADAEAIIAHLHDTDTDKSRCKGSERLCIDRVLFDTYLHSTANDAYDPESLEFDESEMNHSLSSYFISSSHNTYLMGDQLKSTSSVEMYMAALQRGCKCLEIDCWDGDGDGDDAIVVYHGYTLTSHVSFTDVIECVRRYIDQHPGTYPIILSLENHCSISRQRKMASLLRTTLGDRLYIPEASEISKDLPSAHALKGMVVIKGKRPAEPDSKDIVTRHDDEDFFDPYDEALHEPSAYTSYAAEQKKANKFYAKIAFELAQITLFHSCEFQSFQKSLSLSPSHMHSMNETSVGKILAKDPSNAEMWVKYNHRHFTRTYPAGSRVDSSNYSPLIPWSLGVQLASLNFQTADSPLILNDGFFRRNGGCGYILKPKELLRGNDQSVSVLPDGPRILRIRVVGASCLPKPKGEIKGEIIDPYARVRLHDIVPDNGKNVTESNRFLSSSLYPTKGSNGIRQVTTTHTTRFVHDNGYSPVWRKNSWAEFRIYNESMAMLQFCVRDKDYGADESVAEAAIPVSCLRSGYRCVRLYDAHNTRSGPFDFATLLIEVEHVRPSLVKLQLHTTPSPASAGSVEEQAVD